jgi:hypothetical protein
MVDPLKSDEKINENQKILGLLPGPGNLFYKKVHRYMDI